MKEGCFIGESKMVYYGTKKKQNPKSMNKISKGAKAARGQKVDSGKSGGKVRAGKLRNSKFKHL